jgi:hypothetical protein
MRALRIVAAGLVSSWCALCVASCAVGPDHASETEGAAPDKGTETAAAPDIVGEAPEAAGILRRVRCPDSDSGMDCMQRCAETGISCASGLRHPYRGDGGQGELFECRGLSVARSCWYYYPAIDEKCVLLSGGFITCGYKGGK